LAQSSRFSAPTRRLTAAAYTSSSVSNLAWLPCDDCSTHAAAELAGVFVLARDLEASGKATAPLDLAGGPAGRSPSLTVCSALSWFSQATV
jgi:hypothetical protein